MAELLVYVKRNNNLNFDDGDIICSLPDQHIQHIWYEMLVKGTHGYKDIPFIPELYKQYFERLYIKRDKSIVINRTPNCNVRDELLGKHVIRAVDHKIKDIPFPLSITEQEAIFKYFGLIKQEQEFSTKKIYECWSWGIEEVKLFLLVHIPDSEFDHNNQTIYNLAAPLFATKEADPTKQTIVKRHRYFIDYNIHQSELQLDKTVSQTVTAENEKVSNYFTDLANKSVVNTETKLIDVVKNPNIPVYNRFDLNLSKSIISEKKSLIGEIG